MPRNSSVFDATIIRSARWAVSCSENLDAPCPRADGGVAAAIGHHDGQRVSRARIALDRDEHAPASHKRFVNAAVVRLIPDAAHRRGDPELGEIARLALERADERAARE